MGGPSGLYLRWQKPILHVKPQGLPSEFSWDDKTAGAQLLMWEVTGDSTYRQHAQVDLGFLD